MSFELEKFDGQRSWDTLVRGERPVVATTLGSEDHTITGALRCHFFCSKEAYLVVPANNVTGTDGTIKNVP